MTSDAHDQVSPDAYDRSLPVPQDFAVTFGNGPDYWLNQENGQASDPPPMPSRDDVEQGEWWVFGWKG